MNLAVRLPDLAYERAVEAAKAKRLAPSGWLTGLVKARARDPRPVVACESRGRRIVGHASARVEVLVRSHLLNEKPGSLGRWLSGVVHEAVGLPPKAIEGRPAPRPRMKRASAKPCGLCSGCDEERFAGWLARIEVGLPTDAGEGFAPLGRGGEEGAREVLAAEIRDDVARRHPFGVAVRLGAVIATLAACDANEDRDAIRDLADLIEDEQASQRLNGSSVTCSAWAKRAEERRAAAGVKA